MTDGRVAFVLLLLLYVQGTSSFFYQSSTQTPVREYSCLPGLTMGQLANITVTMADMSTFYSYFLSQILIPRLPDTPTHSLVRQFVANEMRSLGWTVELDTFEASTPFGPRVFTNIISTWKPTAVKRIVFACHYDSKFMEGTPNFAGATDSAVPCSILLDTAWKLNQSLYAQDVTPQFIFFDGEEAFVRWTNDDSLYGSRHLAFRWQNQLDPNDQLASNNLENIEFFVLLDLIGGANLKFTDFFYNTSSQFYHLHLIDYCLQNTRIQGRRIIPAQRGPRPMFDLWAQKTQIQDDHIPFIERGVPILHLISVPFPRVWHKPEDDLAHLDRPTIARFTTIFRLFFFRLFNGAFQF